MSEKLGVEKLKVLVADSVKILNAVSAFAHKQGLIALFPVIGAAQDLVKLDYAAVKAELLDLSAAESDELEAVLKAGLHLQNQAVQVKLSEAVDILQELAALVVEELALIEKGSALVFKVKALLS